MDICKQIAISISRYSILGEPQDSALEDSPFLHAQSIPFTDAVNETSKTQYRAYENNSKDESESDSYAFLKAANMNLYFIVKRLVHSNETLEYLPLVTNYHNLERTVDLLQNHSILGDYTWSPCLTVSFIKSLLYNGFMPLCQDVESMDEKWYVLLPKLHNERCIMQPKDVHVPRNCRKISKRFTMTIDTVGKMVLEECNKRHEKSWLHPPLLHEFAKMLSEEKLDVQKVHMHSIEVWSGQELVAGEIGTTLGSIYQSLTGFSKVSSSGTVQMCALGGLLKNRGYELWDLGMYLPYKESLGAYTVPRAEFMKKFRSLRDMAPIPLWPKERNKSHSINCEALIKHSLKLELQ